MTDPRTTEARDKLLNACRDRYKKALSGNDASGDRRRVRDGLLAAEHAINSVATEGTSVKDYLTAVIAALDLEWSRLAADDGDDEDHWAAGGVRTISNEARALLDRTDAPRRWWPWRRR